MMAGQVERYAVGEWDRLQIPGVTLTAADCKLLGRLEALGEGRLRVEADATGLRVQTRSWVGLVRLGSVQINVVPKLAGEYVGLVRLLEWLADLDELTDLGSDPQIDLGGSHLLDLVALLFVREAERVLRRGARSDYVVREESLPVLRGRLLFDRQLRRRLGRVDRLECRHDDRSADIFDNRLLLAAAERCTARVTHVGVRRRASRVRARLARICDAREVALPRRPIPYDRLNAHYRHAHELAWLVLEGAQGLDDLYAAGDTRSFAFMLDMNRLFERFVEQVMRLAVSARGAQLFAQRRWGSIIRSADTGRTYRGITPDVMVCTSDPPASVPVDAKYKRYSGKKVDREDLAQLFLYTASLGAQPGGRPSLGLIVHPAESRELERVPLSVRRMAGGELVRIDVLGIPIPRVLNEVAGGGHGAVVGEISDAVLGRAAAGMVAPCRRWG